MATATRLPAIVHLLRPAQWVKNVFVCAGVLFGGRLGDPRALSAMLLAIAAFSLMGSAAYVMNDYLDREADRAHPRKRDRPIASGALTPGTALVVALACFAGSVTAALGAGPRVVLLVGAYLAVNIGYSLFLKHEPVVDVFCIAAGFMLRILAGTAGIGIPPSGWLLLTGMFVTLFLGFSKRRAEWVDAAGLGLTRRVLTDYSAPLLDSFLAVTATGTALCYGLYTLDAQTIALHGTANLIYTTPFVLFGLFRYLYTLHRQNKGENPSVDLFSDRQLIVCGLAYVASVAWILNRH
jgi:4-hydroxybenzoate polyprenyltransferase